MWDAFTSCCKDLFSESLHILVDVISGFQHEVKISFSSPSGSSSWLSSYIVLWHLICQWFGARWVDGHCFLLGCQLFYYWFSSGYPLRGRAGDIFFQVLEDGLSSGLLMRSNLLSVTQSLISFLLRLQYPLAGEWLLRSPTIRCFSVESWKMLAIRSSFSSR